jgi:hypothetical protein
MQDEFKRGEHRLRAGKDSGFPTGARLRATPWLRLANENPF